MCEFAGRVRTFLRDDAPDAVTVCEDQQIPRGPHWTHEGSLRFATSLKAGHGLAISIREYRPTQTPSHPVVELFHAPYQDGKFSFSPASFHASFVTPTKVTILDVRDSNTLLHTETTQEPYEYSPGFFSPDGRLFACRTPRRDIRVWKNTPDGCIPWSILRPRLPCKGFSFSPATTSILTWGPDGIQLLHPDNHVSPPTPNTIEPDLRRDNHLVTSSTDGTWIATARQGGRIATILDSLSGTLRHSIHAGSQIQDMRFTHNTLLVLCEHSLTRWSAEVDGAREVEVYSGILASLGDVRHHTLSNDGTQIACVKDGSYRSDALLVYDVRSRRIVRGCATPIVRAGSKGVRFFPCGSKLWFWSVRHGTRPGHPLDAGVHVTQLEIEGGYFSSDTAHGLEDGWSLFASL